MPLLAALAPWLLFRPVALAAGARGHEAQRADQGEQCEEMSALQARAFREPAAPGPTQAPAAAPAAAAWVTGPWGDCLRDCGPSRYRSVACVHIFGGGPLPRSSCAGAAPASAQECGCGPACLAAANGTACPEGRAEEGAGAERPAGEAAYREVGCFEEPSGEGGRGGSGDSRVPCLGWRRSAAPSRACMGGLPFFSYRDRHLDADGCFSFCAAKGMDVFGLQGRATCRCGASAANALVWRAGGAPAALRFDPERLRPFRGQGAGCPLRVFRYAGAYEGGGLPSGYWRATISDAAVRESVLRDAVLEADALEDLPGAPASLVQAGEAGGQAPAWTRSCWPSNCGPSAGLWPARSQFPPYTHGSTWPEYVLVNYYFVEELDAARKEVFRSAADAWGRATCIALVEQPAQPSGPHVQVGNFDDGGCWVSRLGPNNPTQLNLGWCNNMLSLGSVIHEIGHALGMNHEQKRPDAQANYHGQGPYLQMHWQNVPADWTYQYLPDSSSYVGSAKDGPYDAEAGYAPYDFGSVMHYPASDRFDTIPESSKSLVGQRSGLSDGDVRQANDMYQCYRRQGSAWLTTQWDWLCLDYHGGNNNVYMGDCHFNSNQQWYFDGEYIKSPYNPSMCLDYSHTGNAYMHPCHGGANQRWYFDGPLLKSRQDGNCLDYAVHWPGRNVIVWPCHADTNQKWHFVSGLRLRSQATSKCVDHNMLTDNVYAHTCHGGANQKWTLSGGQMKNRYFSWCLDASHTGNAYMHYCHGGANQQWRIEGGSGVVEVKSEQDGRCLDVDGPSGNVQMWSCHGGNNQKWLLEAVW